MPSDLKATCVATTGDTFNRQIQETWKGSKPQVHRRPESNQFREAQFSGDGTTILTHSEDQCLRAFVLPPDLLDDAGKPHTLSAHCCVPSSSPLQSYALYPGFDLQNPSTTVALSAAKSLPVKLTNVIHNNTIHASYPLVNQTTEEYISPSSLAWSRDGSQFVAGSKDLLAVFDASYDGSGPIIRHKTSSRKTDLRGCRGIISALSISLEGVLAAGTLLREVALYSSDGSGECITSFSLSGGQADPCKGNGVSQLTWSPCGTYLFIAERQSDVIQVYDLRNTLSRVSRLSERKAMTTQRLGIDVVPTAEGCEVWAGSTDGCVRMWRNPGRSPNEQEPNEVFQLHQGALTSWCSDHVSM